MDGYYKAHRVTCQGCLALHLETDSRPRRPAETVWVSDEDPSYTPDPRMMQAG